MDQWMVEVWLAYDAAVRGVYREGDDGELVFLGSDASEEALDQIADLSSQITEVCAALYASENPTDVIEAEAAVLSTAAVDAAVAADVLRGVPESRELIEQAKDSEEYTNLEQLAPARQELEPIGQLLAEAGVVFPEYGTAGGTPAGAAPGAPEVLDRADQTIQQLLDKAVPVGARFGIHFVAAGANGLVGALGGFRAIGGIVTQADGRLRGGLRLVANVIGKLVVALGGEDAVADFTGEMAFDELGDRLMTGGEGVTERVVRWVVRIERAEDEIGRIVARAQDINDQRVLTLDGELGVLTAHYAQRMKKTAVLGKWIGRFSPYVVATLPGAGLGIIETANGLGLAYVFFSLADRLDTVRPPLGRIDGVPTILEKSLGRSLGPK